MAGTINQDLVKRCREGDVSSFEKLFYLLKDDVYNLAFRMLGSCQDAEDITQETFIRIWTKLKSFRMESSIRTWVYRVTVNLCYDALEKRCRIPFAEKPAESFREHSAGDDPLYLLSMEELKDRIEETFSKLTPGSRLILTLRESEELPYREIADILDCSVDAAKKRVHRARVEFCRIISKYLEDEG